MMGNEPAVVVEDLSRRFGAVPAVDGLRFSVRRGELFGLLGPDGAGKTTTLRMLAGVLRPTAGDARLNGISVTHDPERVKPHLAYMSQRFGLYADLTVRENIEFYADLYLVPECDRPARLKRLYAFSRLGPFEDRLAGALSGGMKQKLGLCCALIHQPSILLLDEPTFGVDPVSRRDLWMIIHDMVGQGTTVVVSTAYMDEAERFDRVALLHRGRVRALDAPHALQQQLRGATLVARTSDARRAREIIRNIPGVHRAEVFGETVHVSVDSGAESGPRIVSALRRAGVDVIAVDPTAPTMEDVFMEFMSEAEHVRPS